MLHQQPVGHLVAVAAVAMVGFPGNEIVARYRIRGDRSDPPPWSPTGCTPRTDGFTSLAVLSGAGGVAIGWDRADPVVGPLITTAILSVRGPRSARSVPDRWTPSTPTSSTTPPTRSSPST